MVIPEEQDGKLEDDPNLSRDTTPANATVNTRKGGAVLSNIQQKVGECSQRNYPCLATNIFLKK